MIEFDWYEINALNKLLGSVKFEKNLGADDINHFAISPYIISAFKKIHSQYVEVFHQIESVDINDNLDFELSNAINVDDIAARINALEDKEYILSLNDDERLTYCKLLFAPFIPTNEQKQKIFETLESLR